MRSPLTVMRSDSLGRITAVGRARRAHDTPAERSEERGLDRTERSGVRSKHPQSFLARTMAPMAAARRTNVTARNGARYGDRI